MRSVWLQAYPGAIGTRCGASLLGGTYERRKGESTGLTHIFVAPDEMLTFGLKSWSRGQKSQDASTTCSGGVSTIIGTSDLDVHTLVSGRACGNQPSCSLPGGPALIKSGNGVAMLRITQPKRRRQLRLIDGGNALHSAFGLALC